MSEIKEKFKIGEYSFDTFHEYRDAQEDVKKIEVINEELDIHDPEVAVRLYNSIRDGEIIFKSQIGEKFFDHVDGVGVLNRAPKERVNNTVHPHIAENGFVLKRDAFIDSKTVMLNGLFVSLDAGVNELDASALVNVRKIVHDNASFQRSHPTDRKLI